MVIFTGTTCRECVRQANPRDATGGPLPHTGCKFENQEPVFVFPVPRCLECANQEKWQRDYNSGNIYCPGAPRVHTRGR